MFSSQPSESAPPAGLWPRYDGRDARVSPRESTQSRSRERRVPQGRDRADPAAKQLGGCHHLELRHHLSGDKDRVLAEAFRVLSLGVASRSPMWWWRGEVSPQIRRNVELWIGCVAEPSKRRSIAGNWQTSASRRSTGTDPYLSRRGRARVPHRQRYRCRTIALQMEGKLMSAFVRARKPVTRRNKPQSTTKPSGKENHMSHIRFTLRSASRTSPQQSTSIGRSWDGTCKGQT